MSFSRVSFDTVRCSCCSAQDLRRIVRNGRDWSEDVDRCAGQQASRTYVLAVEVEQVRILFENIGVELLQLWRAALRALEAFWLRPFQREVAQSPPAFSTLQRVLLGCWGQLLRVSVLARMLLARVRQAISWENLLAGHSRPRAKGALVTLVTSQRAPRGKSLSALRSMPPPQR